MQRIFWNYFKNEDVHQFIDECNSTLYWIKKFGDSYTLNYSSDLFNLDMYDILDISEEVTYLKLQAEKHYNQNSAYIV